MSAMKKMLKPYYADDLITLYKGNAREILPQLGKCDMVFTDPPYGHNNNDGDLIHNWSKHAQSPMTAQRQTSLCAGCSRRLRSI